MKVVSFLIMSASLAVTFGQQATKLLRVPKVYNTLISTDDDLLPSLAYKAVSPVIKSLVPNPYYPYAPLVNVVQHDQVLIPPQDNYRHQFEADPQATLYEHKGVYNDLISSLIALNQSLTPADSVTAAPEQPAMDKAKKERFADIRNNRNRNPSIPDVPPPPLPVKVKKESAQERLSSQNHQHPGNQGYQQPSNQGYQQPSNQGYQQPSNQGYQQPNEQGYQQPGSQGYQQPNEQYQQPGNPGYQQPGSQDYPPAPVGSI